MFDEIKDSVSTEQLFVMDTENKDRIYNKMTTKDPERGKTLIFYLLKVIV